jgi:EAL domain-containing protein (putative c-di-GMP-specific phosphodiesterase class I)
VFFAREMHERMQQRASIEDGLRSAIANGELELHYQPIIHRGQIISAEGLLRWTTAAGERISPATFIPVAEDSGLIREIGIWVVNEACRHLAAWKAQDIAPPFLSINVAPEQLRDDWFVSRVAGALRRFSIDPSWLQIEITESAIADGALASMRLRELSEVGVRIALDDFGAGYSSLSTLQTLPIDVIKIDRSFITKVPQSLSACRLIEAIVRMAEGLEKRVIAEGVETAEQAEFLIRTGCYGIQGYLYGRPMPAAQFGMTLAERQRADVRVAG